MSSSKALRTVRPPNPESNTPMVGRRREAGSSLPGSALIHLVPRELAAWAHGFPHLGDRLLCATRPGRNWRSVRTGSGVSEERANLVRRFRRKNVFELASLLLDLRFTVKGKAVGKKPPREPVPPDNAASALAPARSELDN